MNLWAINVIVIIDSLSPLPLPQCPHGARLQGSPGTWGGRRGTRSSKSPPRRVGLAGRRVKSHMLEDGRGSLEKIRQNKIYKFLACR